jgi:hypothetical protein
MNEEAASVQSTPIRKDLRCARLLPRKSGRYPNSAASRRTFRRVSPPTRTLDGFSLSTAVTTDGATPARLASCLRLIRGRSIEMEEATVFMMTRGINLPPSPIPRKDFFPRHPRATPSGDQTRSAKKERICEKIKFFSALFAQKRGFQKKRCAFW